MVYSARTRPTENAIKHLPRKPNLMLTSVSLKFGSSPGQPPLTFEPGSITVFVGPNHSGKSLILREIENFARTGSHSTDTKIFHTLREKMFSLEQVKRMFIEERHILPPNIVVDDASGSFQIFDPMRGSGGGLGGLLNNPELLQSNLPGISRTIIANSTLALDGRTRLIILGESGAGDLQGPPSGLLAALYRNDAARQWLRELTRDAFGVYFTIDPTYLGQFRVRMSAEAPQGQERSLSADAIEFFKRTTNIAEFSDGVKAFTGILAAVICAQYLIILIDEPEAFLHPPLVRKLGRRLTEIASDRGGVVFASTHSADFLIGAMQAGKNVNVIRLTYRHGVPTARLLEASRLTEMMRNPFLRSSGVLSALFHEGAVVCEADTDRSFYQEVNERLLFFGEGGIDNCVCF